MNLKFSLLAPVFLTRPRKDLSLTMQTNPNLHFVLLALALSFLTWITIPGVFGHRYLMLLIALMNSGLVTF